MLCLATGVRTGNSVKQCIIIYGGRAEEMSYFWKWAGFSLSPAIPRCMFSTVIDRLPVILSPHDFYFFAHSLCWLELSEHSILTSTPFLILPASTCRVIMTFTLQIGLNVLVFTQSGLITGPKIKERRVILVEVSPRENRESWPTKRSFQRCQLLGSSRGELFYNRFLV